MKNTYYVVADGEKYSSALRMLYAGNPIEPRKRCYTRTGVAVGKRSDGTFFANSFYIDDDDNVKFNQDLTTITPDESATGRMILDMDSEKIYLYYNA